MKTKWFHGWKSTAILINGRPFKHDYSFITGKQIKDYAGDPSNYGVWLMCSPKDKKISDDEKVVISTGLKFFTGPIEVAEG